MPHQFQSIYQSTSNILLAYAPFLDNSSGDNVNVTQSNIKINQLQICAFAIKMLLQLSSQKPTIVWKIINALSKRNS